MAVYQIGSPVATMRSKPAFRFRPRPTLPQPGGAQAIFSAGEFVDEVTQGAKLSPDKQAVHELCVMVTTPFTWATDALQSDFATISSARIGSGFLRTVIGSITKPGAQV
jgi:hypothetical protein